MSEPKWLTPDEAIRINEKVVERSNEPHFVRDQGLLESALARPQNLHAYGEADTFQLAASYVEGVSRNHAFEQGNKRTAFECADMFLSQNGYEMQKAKGLEHVEMMEQLGKRNISREDAAEHFREHSHSLQQEESQSETQEDTQRRSARDSMQEQQNRTRDRGR